MGARYHIPQADYPHSTADGLAQIHGSPSQKSSAPAFGLVAFSAGLPVKAAGEAINQTASSEINFTGKRRGAKSAYSPGPSTRAALPGLHSGTTHAKSLADVHSGVRSVSLPSQGGPTQSASNAIASNTGTRLSKRRPVGMPPVSMSNHSAAAFSRKQAGVPSSPSPSRRSGGAMAMSPTQGKTPVVHAAVAGARRSVTAKPIVASPPKTPTFASKTPKPGIARPAQKTATPAPKPVVTVTTPTMSTRTGKGHF